MSDSSSPGTPPEPTRGDVLCADCGHDHIRPFAMGHIRIDRCWEWPRCKCLKFAPLAPSSAPAPEHVPAQEQDEGKTAKAATASPSQLESRASRDATGAEPVLTSRLCVCGHQHTAVRYPGAGIGACAEQCGCQEFWIAHSKPPVRP